MSTGTNFTNLMTANLTSGSTANSGEDLKNSINAVTAALDGSIGTPNIEASAITTAKIADSIDPIERWNDGMPDFKKTSASFLMSTATTSSTLAAGICYIDGVRVSTTASEVTKAWTVAQMSKTVYVSLDKDKNVGYKTTIAPDTGYKNLCSVAISASGTATSVTTMFEVGAVMINPFMKDYRVGITPFYSSSSVVKISTGEVTLANTSSNIYVKKRLTTTATVAATDLDAGAALAASTGYFIYAHSDQKHEYLSTSNDDFIISTASATASVTGVRTYGKKVGWFKTDSSGDILAHSVGGYTTRFYKEQEVTANFDITASTTGWATATVSYIYIPNTYTTYKAHANAVVVATSTANAYFTFMSGSTSTAWRASYTATSAVTLQYTKILQADSAGWLSLNSKFQNGGVSAPGGISIASYEIAVEVDGKQ